MNSGFFDVDQSGQGELPQGSSLYIQIIGDTPITYITNYAFDRNRDNEYTVQRASTERKHKEKHAKGFIAKKSSHKKATT